MTQPRHNDVPKLLFLSELTRQSVNYFRFMVHIPTINPYFYFRTVLGQSEGYKNKRSKEAGMKLNMEEEISRKPFMFSGLSNPRHSVCIDTMQGW